MHLCADSIYAFFQNYGSLESMEPAKVIVEKDGSRFDSTLVSEIDHTMKKYTDNLLHALDGVSARISQLETRTRQIENSVDDLKLSVGNNFGGTDGKLRQLENILREVQSICILSPINLLTCDVRLIQVINILHPLG